MTLGYLYFLYWLQLLHQLGVVYLCKWKFLVKQMNVIVHMMRNTLSWKSHCPCDTLTSVYSSSGHHSDGVCCVALEVSEGGLSCCWVTELLGGLTTSLRTVGHSSGVEAVGSWA